MIWASTTSGDITYAGPEWATFTGQPTVDALGAGWEAMLHPDDRASVRSYFAQACTDVATFTVAYRLRRTDGSYAHIIAGAAPSISPIDGNFIGFLGAIVEVDASNHPLPAERSILNRIGRLDLPPPNISTKPSTAVDKLCDHVLMARAEAEAAGETTLFACLDLAVSILFARLGSFAPSMN